MPTVFSEMLQWVNTLPYWEQAAFEKIYLGIDCEDADYEEILHYLLEDASLEKTTQNRNVLKFKAATLPDKPTNKVTLSQISNVSHVNALVTGQTISFGQGVTAIFGANASGKSGYARILGCAGFTRGDTEILPDITYVLPESTVLTAEITIAFGDEVKVISYTIGETCPELSQFYVFDSTSVIHHLIGSHKFSFSPANLFYLTKLAELTDNVRGRLKTKIAEYSRPHNLNMLFVGDSDIARKIINLGPNTIIPELKQLAVLTTEERKRVKELESLIAGFKAKNAPKQVEIINQTINDLRRLSQKLQDLADKICDPAIAVIKLSIKNRDDKRAAAKRYSIDQFKSPHFSQTGSEVWREFVVAAQTLAEAEQLPDRIYPQSDSFCLLCQQPLGAEARGLLLRLWEFLKGEAQENLVKAQTELDIKLDELRQININFFNDQSVYFRHLENNKETIEQITKFIQICQRRRDLMVAIINGLLVDEVMPNLTNSGLAGINEVILSLNRERTRLEKESRAEEVNQLEKELINLQHRDKLNQNWPQIEEYVNKRIWAEKASKIAGDTGHITIKHNALFKKLVTDRYVELFEKILKDLGRPLKVKIETVGSKAETYKQIVLQTAMEVEGATPDRVLSEGEKRAVALADFLTEVALDTYSSGIVLDDPVTSLDLEWRETIAQILVEEAKHRQVIIFTHDLPFLYFIKKQAEIKKVDLAAHWIKRGEIDDKPGYVFCDNSPALEKDFKTATLARELYKRARAAAPQEQERLLRDGFGALRTAYESFIIFEMFNGVVERFEERVNFLRLRQVRWDQEIANTVVDKCEELSRFIEGHSHSDALGALKTKPERLIREIEEFDSLRKKLSEAKPK